MKKPTVAVLLTLVLLGTMSLVACASTVKETRTNTFSVGPNPVVDVAVGNGDVELVIGSEGSIAVSAILRKPEDVTYEVSQDGDSITVHAETKADSRADVTVTVPENTEFALSTGNGNVDAVDVQASGEVHSGNGSITLEGVTGDVEVSVGNGNVRLQDATGSFELHVGNGDVTFRGDLTPSGHNTFSIGSGDVTVELTGSPSVVLDLESDDGEVKSDLSVTVTEMSEGRLVGTIGNGEAALTVNTGSGNITIK